ncbi:MAG: hypothetical protein WDO14_03265 [Bacteroidota bacterium]
MRAYVEAIEGFSIRAIDLKTEKITEDELSNIAIMLDVDVPDLFDPVCAVLANVDFRDLSKENALKLLANNTMLLSTPVIIIGEHAYQFESSYELINENATITGIKRNEA